MNMILSFILMLILVGNGVSSFQACRWETTRQFENSSHRRFSHLRTSLIEGPVIRSVPQQQFRSSDIIQRRASETSFRFTDALPSSPKSLKEVCGGLDARYPWIGVAASQVATTKQALSTFALKSWWIWPMMLAIIPVHSAVFKGTCASMPHWWPVVKMDMIRQSNDAALVIGGFLLSNIAYFVSGAFLVQKFPFKTTQNGLLPIRPTKFTNLGLWILLAGAVSTIFHSVQALGSYAVAESLCYVDHGIALSAGLYFLNTCGFPSRKVMTLGIAALATLVISHPYYAILHSTWHFLSAAVATTWAVEGYYRLTT